jgi:hypothetical protein
LKICSKCKSFKDENCFNKCKSNKDGLMNYCKDCQHLYSKNWKKQNPEQNKRLSKKFYENNKERIKKSVSKYKKQNKEKILKSLKEWIKKNPEKVKAYKKISKGKRKSIYKTTDITSSFLVCLKEEVKNCPMCGNLLNDVDKNPNQYNLDHIIPLNVGGKHSKDNVRYICRRCNVNRPKIGKDIMEKINA